MSAAERSAGLRVEEGAGGGDAAGLSAAAGGCRADTGSGLVLPPLTRAVAGTLQAAPRGWLPTSSMPIGFFSRGVGSALPWGVVFLSTLALVLVVLTL